MNPTTLPRPTRQPHECAAEAIADHYRRHGADRTATAALELAVVLADVVDPAQLNTIADRLDLLSFGAGDAARIARGRIDPFAVALRAVIDDDETDPAGDGTYDGGDDGYPPAHEYDGPHYDTPRPQS